MKFRKSEIDDWIESQNHKKGIQVQSCERMLQILEKNADEIMKFGVRRIGLFGSSVRGEGNPESDIDVLVEFVRPSFDRYMELKFFLEDLLGRNVDLVLTDTLKKRIKPNILKEVVYVPRI